MTALYDDAIVEAAVTEIRNQYLGLTKQNALGIARAALAVAAPMIAERVRAIDNVSRAGEIRREAAARRSPKRDVPLSEALAEIRAALPDDAFLPEEPAP